MKDLQAAGIEVWTYQDKQRVKFDTAADKMMFGVNAFGSEHYRETIVNATREALVRKARVGHFTGQRTYGYTSERVGDHSERRINETQAAVVRRVFDLAAAGAGDLKIARTLPDEHVSAPGPKGWSKQIVRHLLTNPLYIGQVSYGRTKTIDDGARGRRVAVPQDDWTTVTLPGLQIVPEAVWTAVQQRKAKTREHYLRAPDGRLLMGKPESGLAALHLLNGIARCGDCGGALTHMMKSGRAHYYCATYRARGTCRNARGIPAFTFEAAVCKALHALLVDNREETSRLLAEEIERLKREHTAHSGGAQAG